MRCFYSMLFTSQQKMSKNCELFINVCNFTIYLLNDILPEHEPSDSVNDALQDLLNAIIKYRKLVKNNALVVSEPINYSASSDNVIFDFSLILSNTSENSPFYNNKNFLNDTGLNLKQENSTLGLKKYLPTPDNEIIPFPSTLTNTPERSPFDKNLKETELNLKHDSANVSPVDSAIPDLLFTDHILMKNCQQSLNVKQILQRKLDVSTSKSYKNLEEEDKESLNNKNGKNIHKKVVPPANLSKLKGARTGRKDKKIINETVTNKSGLNLENEVTIDGETFSKNSPGNLKSNGVKEGSTKVDTLPTNKFATDISCVHSATEEHYPDEVGQEVDKLSDSDCDRKAKIVSPNVKDVKDTLNTFRPLDETYIPDSLETLNIILFKKLVNQVYYCWKCEITIDQFDEFHCHGRRHVHDGLSESYVFLEVCSACKLVLFLPENRLQQISTFHMKNHKEFSDKELHSSGIVSTKCLELFPFDNFDDVTFVRHILERKFNADKQTATSSSCYICLICKTYFNNPLEWTYHIHEFDHFNISPKADIVSCNTCCIVFLDYTKNDIAKYLSIDMHIINCPEKSLQKINNV